MHGHHEWFDVLDPHGQPTGERKYRHQVHRDGDWHGAVHVWIFLADGSLLLQHRSPSKDLAPGKIDVSVGGHLSAGETWLDALREVEEEIGVELPHEGFAVLGTHASERIYAETIDREHQVVIAARLDVTLPELHMHPEEVMRLYAAPWPEVLGLWRHRVTVSAQAVGADGALRSYRLTPADLIEEAFPEILHELDLLEAWCATQPA